eukprot:3210912-Rhodomonas_salina.1
MVRSGSRGSIFKVAGKLAEAVEAEKGWRKDSVANDEHLCCNGVRYVELVAQGTEALENSGWKGCESVAGVRHVCRKKGIAVIGGMEDGEPRAHHGHGSLARGLWRTNAHEVCAGGDPRSLAGADAHGGFCRVEGEHGGAGKQPAAACQDRESYVEPEAGGIHGQVAYGVLGDA